MATSGHCRQLGGPIDPSAWLIPIFGCIPSYIPLDVQLLCRKLTNTVTSSYMHVYTSYIRAVATSPAGPVSAGPVLAGPLFLKAKIKLDFTKS